MTKANCVETGLGCNPIFNSDKASGCKAGQHQSNHYHFERK
jgi:hypothetical protein